MGVASQIPWEGRPRVPAGPHLRSEEGEAEETQNQDQPEAGEDAALLAGRGEGHWGGELQTVTWNRSGCITPSATLLTVPVIWMA